METIAPAAAYSYRGLRFRWMSALCARALLQTDNSDFSPPKAFAVVALVDIVRCKDVLDITTGVGGLTRNAGVCAGRAGGPGSALRASPDKALPTRWKLFADSTSSRVRAMGHLAKAAQIYVFIARDCA